MMGDQLGEFGDALVRVWEKEQNLQGFYAERVGPGRDLRRKLVDAVKEGLDKSTVARGQNWYLFWDLAPLFALYNCGRKESQTIYKYISGDEQPTRNEIVRFLLSEEGQNVWSKSSSEKQFHQALTKSASKDLRQLLHVIQKYEQFARILQNAFDACLFRMSQPPRPSISDLARLDEIMRATKELPDLTREIIDLLEPYGHALNFETHFEDFATNTTAQNWLDIFTSHHFKIQKEKPPNGKRPWFEKTENGDLLIYPGYVRDNKPDLNDEYVNFYRTAPLWSFMKDLRKVKNG